nr:hypothetical protein [Tanacetum cinerariifolium]
MVFVVWSVEFQNCKNSPYFEGSDGNLRSCLSGQGGLGGYRESRSDRSGSRVKAFRRIRVGSWNTKWKGYSNKEVNGYKLWYSGSQTARNEVGVILRVCLKDKVVNVNRCNDRIISLTLVIEGETVNVITVYAPQVGFGYGLRNKEGRSILDFATTHDLAVVNSYIKKRDHHLITFQSRGRCTQINYLLVRRGDLKACKDCKVFPGEACYFQNRLLAMDTLFKRGQRRRVGSATPRILWKNLNSNATEAFRSRVSEGVSTQIEAISASDANSMWNILASIIKDAAKDSLGVAIGISKTHTYRRITKARQKRRWDLRDICFIKDEAGRTITDEEEIKQRGENTFPLFLTQENQRDTKELWTRTHYRLSIITTRGLVRRKVIKLISHTMKLYERVIERRLRKKTSVFENQFGFMPGRSSIEAIHLIRSLMEKYRDRQRDLYLAFIDLVKAYDSVPQDLKTLIEKGASRRYIKREALEANDLRVSREKTEYLRCDFSNSEIAHNKEVKVCIGDKILQPKESFRHLGSMLYKSERIDKDVAHHIKAAWLKPAMLYGSECWPITKSLANRMEVAELTMLRRRPQSAPVKRVEALVVNDIRRRGRLKLRWEDKVKLSMKELLLSKDMTSYGPFYLGPSFPVSSA